MEQLGIKSAGQEHIVPVQPVQRRRFTASQKAIRTYEGDVAEVLSHRKSSTASIAIAENRKNTGEERLGTAENSGQRSHATRNILITLISLILIGGGAVGAYYLYSISPLFPSTKSAPQAGTQATSSLVPSDSKAVISIDGMSYTGIISAVRAEMARPQDPDTLKEIILTQTDNGQRFRVSAPDMENIMGIRAPDILLRALSDDWMLGVYADKNGAKTAFVLATVDYFQNAFAGMLQWEGLMADDLKQYLYQNTPSDIASMATATTTATSTIPETVSQPYVILRGSFVDRIIHNKDVREFITSDGRALFLYSFIDNTKLVVAGSETALSDILDRLEQQTFVR